MRPCRIIIALRSKRDSKALNSSVFPSAIAVQVSDLRIPGMQRAIRKLMIPQHVTIPTYQIAIVLSKARSPVGGKTEEKRG